MNLRGIEFELHENEMLSNAIQRDKDFFEAQILDYIAGQYPIHQGIVDVGANIGNHSVFFANFLKYEYMVVFEPVPENHDILVRNLAPYPNVVIMYMAVGDTLGTVAVHANRQNMGASQVSTDNGETVAPIVPLDLFYLPAVSLMKIDVEGMEDKVLRGAKRIIEESRPLLLVEDWTFGNLKMPTGYELEKSWEREFTYLYRWSG